MRKRPGKTLIYKHQASSSKGIEKSISFPEIDTLIIKREASFLKDSAPGTLGHGRCPKVTFNIGNPLRT